VAVMYLGKIVEQGSKVTVFDRPMHPYTRALLASTPKLRSASRLANPNQDDGGASRRERITLKGELPSPLNPPSGCTFHKRCPYAIERCRVEVPALRQLGDTRVACHRAEELPSVREL
jgi:dipeptide transport system ATP-binding protein